MVAGERIAFANSLRGLAALCVVIGHYCGVYWLQRGGVAAMTAGQELPPTVPTPALARWIADLPYDLEWGPFGVALFFLISGFVIPFSIARYSNREFAVARLFRILPTYAAGFALTVLAIALSAWHSGLPFPHSAYRTLVHSVAGLRDILGHHTIDSIVWTLEVELKFYVLCLLIAPWLRRASPLVFLAPVACALFVITVDLGHLRAPGRALWANSPHLVFMFVGVALHFYHQGRMSLMRTAAVSFVLLALFATLALTEPRLGLWLSSYLLALVAFLLAMTFPAMVPDRGPIRVLAAISYPLYVVHGVAGYVVMTALLRSGMGSLLAICLTSACAVAVAWGLHRVCEVPSQRLGSRLARRRYRTASALPIRAAT